MISVVIPTKDRSDDLGRTLAALARQRAPEGGFEVVVADNGSGDDTQDVVREFQAGAEVSVRLVTESRPGPAAARNRGVGAARGETVLFLGDDTEPVGDDLLARHAELQRGAGDDRFGVLGAVVWSDRQEVTPLMEWLERAGYQFDYGSLSEGPVLARDAFWTAHVSISRSLFERAGGFDQRFPYAAVEDVELGSRFDRLGITLEYHPDLAVSHTHPTDLDASLRRMERVGRSAALFHEIHPGMTPPGLPEPGRIRGAVLGGSAPLWRALARSRAGRVRESAWKALHSAAYARGFGQGPAGAGP